MTKYKIITFLKSLWFHISLGMPKSSQQTINYRLAICQSCDQFNYQKQECYVCGCNINNKKQFLNKLAWADQECPIGKWPKEI
jgi:uncharacterized paraquat-inducible protein A